MLRPPQAPGKSPRENARRRQKHSKWKQRVFEWKVYTGYSWSRQYCSVVQIEAYKTCMSFKIGHGGLCMVVHRIFGLQKIFSYDVTPIDEQYNGLKIWDRPKVREPTILFIHKIFVFCGFLLLKTTILPWLKVGFEENKHVYYDGTTPQNKPFPVKKVSVDHTVLSELLKMLDGIQSILNKISCVNKTTFAL